MFLAWLTNSTMTTSKIRYRISLVYSKTHECVWLDIHLIVVSMSPHLWLIAQVGTKIYSQHFIMLQNTNPKYCSNTNLLTHNKWGKCTGEEKSTVWFLFQKFSSCHANNLGDKQKTHKTSRCQLQSIRGTIMGWGCIWHTPLSFAFDVHNIFFFSPPHTEWAHWWFTAL